MEALKREEIGRNWTADSVDIVWWVAWKAEEILFRSHDGLFLFPRGDDGSLRAVMAEGGRESWRGDERHRALAAAFDRYGPWSHLTDDGRASARRDVVIGCYPLEFPQLNGAHASPRSATTSSPA